jgi:hypothetical protein
MPGWFHKPTDEQVVIERVAYHRNGIAGNGFHVILFRQFDNTPMVGTVFEERGNVAVFNRQLVGEGNVDFYANSWRGDEFEQALREAVAEYQIATERLPTEKWSAGWSPMVDPIPDEIPAVAGNADASAKLMAAVRKIATHP